MIRDGALLLFGMCMMAVTGCRTPPRPPTEPPVPPGHTIEVQPGQTLWEIARESGLSVEEIVEVNGLENASEVAAGQMLFIPAGAAAVRSTAPGAPRSPPGAVVAEGRPPATRTGAVDPGLADLMWPVEGVVLRDFTTGTAKKEAYEGILIAAPSGTPVLCAKDGVVAFSGSQGTSLGTFVIVEHDGGLVTIYGHLAAAAVQSGTQVHQGSPLGVVGTSGLLGSSPRLQFQVRRHQVPVDPLTLLPP